MLKIGCHLSISKGLYSAAKTAKSINANTFQYFTRNPRGGKAKDLDIEEIKKLRSFMEENEFAPLFAHAAYTMNLASKSDKTKDFAKMILKDDLERVKIIGNTYYIFHPGSHVGQGSDKGIELIIQALNEVIDEDNDTTILLEGMSGKGSEIGRSMEELEKIISGVKYNKNLGICVDTCHLYSAGYDIKTDLDGVLDKIDRTLGLDRLKAIHLNDTKVEFDSNKDRHEIIGEGLLGKETIFNVINHPKLKNLVFNLETPNEVDGHKSEIQMIRDAYN